jgi:hypothetical protein
MKGNQIVQSLDHVIKQYNVSLFTTDAYFCAFLVIYGPAKKNLHKNGLLYVLWNDV